jgi:hypothetical protein
MLKKGSRKRLLFIVFSTLFFSSIIIAAEMGIVKFQGKVMELDLKKNTMIANERTVLWDQNTIFYNPKGVPITPDKLKNKAWVYIEGVSDVVNKRILAQKIYLIPKYIYKKERGHYPFMDGEGD